MIKAISSFFQVQIERMFGYAIKPGQPKFCSGPERLNAVNMPFTIRKLILAMMYPKVLVKAHINQAVAASPAIRTNDSSGVHVTSDHALQRSLGAVLHDPGITFTLSFQQSRYDRFTLNASPTNSPDLTGTRTRLIHFNCVFKRGSHFAGFCHTLANFKINAIHRSKRNASQCSSPGSCKIESKAPCRLPEFSLADSGTAILSVFINHLSRLAHFNLCLTS